MECFAPQLYPNIYEAIFFQHLKNEFDHWSTSKSNPFIYLFCPSSPPENEVCARNDLNMQRDMQARAEPARKRSREDGNLHGDMGEHGGHDAEEDASKKKARSSAKNKQAQRSGRESSVYECTTCGQACSSQSQLTRHLRVHTGDLRAVRGTHGAPSGALRRQALLVRHMRQGLRGVRRTHEAPSGALRRQALLVRHMRQGLRDVRRTHEAPSGALRRQALLVRHMRQGLRGVRRTHEAPSGALRRQALLVRHMRQGLLRFIQSQEARVRPSLTVRINGVKSIHRLHRAPSACHAFSSFRLFRINH